MRCALGGRYDQSGWEEIMPWVQLSMNSTVNASTGVTPFSILYGREAKTAFGETAANMDDFMQNRKDIRDEAADAVAIAQARMKIYYDSNHTPPRFDDLVYLRISKNHEKGYHLQNQTKLSFNKIGPLRILERYKGDLLFKIELPEWLTGIHPVISVEFLEPAPPDPYKRPRPEPGHITIEGEERYIIEKILDKEMRKVPGVKKRVAFYKIKWLDYQDTTWEPESSLRQEVPQLLDMFESERRRR
jgi:hypothetical protein